jgi:acyl-CoA thioesterase-1
VLSYGAFRTRRNVTIAFLLAFAALASPSFAEKLTVLALGDSLTAGYGLAPEDGYVPQLQAWLAAHGADVTILNAGVSGDTTAGGLSRLDWSLTPEVGAMIVNLGGNDMLRGQDPAASQANLDQILAKAAARKLPVLLVGIKSLNNYGPDYKAAFDAMYPTLAAKYHVSLYPDYFAALKSAPDQTQAMAEYMQGDGIHPNAEGVKRILEDIGPHVLDLVKQAQK